MRIIDIIVISIGLAMDAFAVAVGKGLSLSKVKIKDCMIIGLWFGVFQGLMPYIGYLIGYKFAGFVQAIDHWIAFILLGIIGGNMIRESRDKTCEVMDTRFGVREMFPLAVATSIDALAAGISFAFLKLNIFNTVLSIGLITFIISAFGLKLGNIFGCKLKSKAELLGGIILIFMGTRILITHLFFS